MHGTLPQRNFNYLTPETKTSGKTTQADRVLLSYINVPLSSNIVQLSSNIVPLRSDNIPLSFNNVLLHSKNEILLSNDFTKCSPRSSIEMFTLYYYGDLHCTLYITI